MPTPAKQGLPENQGVTGRRSTRLAIAIPVCLSGKDAGGAAFKENTRTIMINKHGAKIATTHQLALGAELTIENRALAQVAKVNVVWLGERRTLKDPYEVGVQLFEPQNIWGIEFPPEDWQEGQSMRGAGTVAAKAKAAEAPAKPIEKSTVATATAGAPRAAEGPKGAVFPSPRSAEATASSLSAVPAAVPGVSPEQTNAAIEATRARFIHELEEATEAQARIFEEKLTNLAQKVGLQAESTLQDASNALLEKTLGSIASRIDPLSERLNNSHAEVESLLARLPEVQQASQSAVEKALGSIQASSSEAVQYALDDLTGKLEQKVQTTMEDCSERARQSVEEAGAAALDSSVQEARQRLDSILAEQLEIAAQSYSTRFREQLKKTSEELYGAVRQDVEKSLEKSTGQFSRQIQQASEDLRESFGKELRKLTDGSMDELRAEQKTAQKSLLNEAKSDLSGLTKSTVESLNREAKAGLDEYRTHLLKERQEHTEKGTKEVIAQVEKTVQKQRAVLLSDLEKASGELGEQALAKVKVRIDAHIENADAALKQHETALKKAQQDAAEAADKAASNLRTQTDQMAKEANAELAKQEEALKQLQQDAAESGKKCVEETQCKLQAIADELVESSAAQLRKQAEETMELFAEELKEKQNQAAEDAADAFRGKIAEILAIFQPGGKK